MIIEKCNSYEEHYVTDKLIGKSIFTQSIGLYVCSNHAKLFVPCLLVFIIFKL